MTVRYRLTLIGAVAVAAVVAGSPALADHLDVTTSEPPTVEPGDIVEIAVVVRSSQTQEPIAGVSVAALMEADIVGVHGTVELARATTGDDGVATLRWQIRSGTTEGVVIAYSEPGGASIESEPLPIVTVGAGTQVVRSESGVKIPGFGAWVLIGIVVLIWALIQFAMLGPVRVALAAAREGEAASAEGDRARADSPQAGGGNP
jgi:hypothetical protein